jgi:hypothetical protein
MKAFLIFINIGIVLSDVTCRDVKTFFQENECCNKSNRDNVVGTCSEPVEHTHNVFNFSNDSYTTPYLLGEYNVEMFELGEKNAEWTMELLHSEGDLDKFGNNNSKLHFGQDFIVRVWVPTIGPKATHPMFPYDEDNTTCEICSSVVSSASGQGLLHDLLVSTLGNLGLGESSEFTDLVKKFTRLSSSNKGKLRETIINHPDYLDLKKLKTRTKIAYNNKAKLMDGIVETEFNFENVIQGQLPVILVQPGDKGTPISLDGLVLYEQLASLGFAVVVFNGPNNHGPMRKLGNTLDSFNYVEFGTTPYESQFAAMGSVYLESEVDEVVVETNNTKDYYESDTLAPFIVGFSWEGIKVPKGADFQCSAVDLCGYVDVDASWSHYSARYYNAHFFEKQFALVKELTNSKLNLDWENVGFLGDGSVWAAATAVSKNGGMSTVYKKNDDFIDLFTLKASLVEDGRFTGTSYIDKGNRWWIHTDVDGGVDHPSGFVESTGIPDWNTDSLQKILRATPLSIRAHCSTVYVPSEEVGKPMVFPLLINGFQYPPLDVMTQGFYGTPYWDPQLYTSAQMETYISLKLLQYEVLWFKRYLSACQICDDNKLPVTLKELYSLGLDVEFSPFSVRGAENKFTEFYIGPFKMHYDEVTNQVMTV